MSDRPERPLTPEEQTAAYREAWFEPAEKNNPYIPHAPKPVIGVAYMGRPPALGRYDRS